MTEKTRRQAIIVIGMHRSGTSAMARVLSLSGAALPRNLMDSSPFNEAGHWEPLPIAEFNERLLAKVDTGWDSMFGPRRNRRGALPLRRHISEARRLLREQYDDEPLIVLKDPRVTLLVDLWEEALEAEGYDRSFVIMLRQPQEVAASLAARDGMATNRALLLWATYMSQADLLTRDARRIFCSYDRLLASPEVVLDEVEDRLGIEFTRRTARSTAEIEGFLQPSLRHHSAATLGPIGADLAPVARLADYFADVAAGKPRNDDVSAETQTWLSSLDSIVTPILLTDETRARAAAAAGEADNNELRRAYHEAAGRLAELNERDAALRAALDEHVLAVAESEREIVALHERLDALTSASEASRMAAEAELFESRQQRDEAVSAVAELRSALATAQDEAEQLARTKEAMSGAHVAALAQRELRAQSMHQVLGAAEAAREAEMGRSNLLEEALAITRTELADAHQMLHDTRQLLGGRNAELEEALAITRTELADARQMLHDARQLLGVRNAELEEALALTRAELADARQMLHDARQMLGARNAELEEALALTRTELADARQLLGTRNAEFEEALALTRTELADTRRLLGEARSAAVDEQTRHNEETGTRIALLREAEERASRSSDVTGRLRGEAARLRQEGERLVQEVEVHKRLAAAHAAKLAAHERSLLGKASRMLRWRPAG